MFELKLFPFVYREMSSITSKANVVLTIQLVPLP